MAKVTFDGANKRIIINSYIYDIDVKEDIYSAWKDWASQVENSHWLPALRSVGGDPLVGARFLGSTFFLLNGWKIRTWEGDHRLIITGNIYSEDGTPISVPTLGGYRTEIQTNTSNLIDTIATNGSSVSTSEIATATASAVWNKTAGEMAPNTIGSYLFGLLKKLIALLGR